MSLCAKRDESENHEAPDENAQHEANIDEEPAERSTGHNEDGLMAKSREKAEEQMKEARSTADHLLTFQRPWPDRVQILPTTPKKECKAHECKRPASQEEGGAS